MAAGYKDFEGYGRPNSTGVATGWSSGKKPNNWQNYDNEAKKLGEENGIKVGNIPWKNKIGGKMKTKCSDNDSDIKLGSQSWRMGRKNWYKNKKLFGEIEFTCQDKKTHTLYLKWDDETSSKRGWYGRVK